MTLRGHIPEAPGADRALVIVDGGSPEPVRQMLRDLFDSQPVDLTEVDLPGLDGDTVVLLEDGAIVASSALEALQEELLLVNSDLFATGARDLEDVTLPAVLEELEGVPFRLQGYPESNTEKVFLILVSRYIERRALEAGEGQLRASFQQLSRIEDEVGTRSVYERLADSGVEVHVYGVPDWVPSRELDLVTHAGRGSNFRNTWFVLFEPGAAAADPFGLLAYEVEPRVWEGFYTGDPDRLDAIGEEIRTRM